MKLSKLIERLTEIKNEKGDVDVNIMTEAVIDGCRNYQFQHDATDIAYSNRSGVIIIGQEIE